MIENIFRNKININERALAFSVSFGIRITHYQCELQNAINQTEIKTNRIFEDVQLTLV